MKKCIFFNVILLVSIYCLNATFAPINYCTRTLNIEQYHNDQQHVVFLFAHGLGGDRDTAFRYAHIRHVHEDGTPHYNKSWFIDDPIASFDFPDAQYPKGFNAQAVNLGQQADIERLHEAYQITRQQFPDDEIILLGVSRGAVTIINFVAQYQPTHIKALILESPFDLVTTPVEQLKKNYKLLRWAPLCVAYAFFKYKFPMINDKGPFPLFEVTKISHDIPVLLIHSVDDDLIPYTASQRLHTTMVKAGHKKCDLVLLPYGEHGHLIVDAAQDQYTQAVFQFYKKYALYNPVAL